MWLERSRGEAAKVSLPWHKRESQRLEAQPSRAGLEPASRATRFTGGGDCFGCGATGDVIDFTARLFGLSSYEAAQKLIADFGLDPDKPPAAAALRKPKYPLVRAFRQDELYCRRVLNDYLRLLEDWRVQYSPHSPKEKLDDRFVESCQMLDYVEHLADILAVGELEHRVKAVQMLLSDGTITRLEERLNRLKKEARQNERNDDFSL